MKALKLRRVDKWGVSIACLLLVAILGWRLRPIKQPQWCKVHNVLLRDEQVKISYGLPGIRLAAGDEYQRLFPNIGSDGGGCVMYPNAPKYKWVQYCPKCRAVFNKWNRGEDVE